MTYQNDGCYHQKREKCTRLIILGYVEHSRGKPSLRAMLVIVILRDHATMVANCTDGLASYLRHSLSKLKDMQGILATG